MRTSGDSLRCAPPGKLGALLLRRIVVLLNSAVGTANQPSRDMSEWINSIAEFLSAHEAASLRLAGASLVMFVAALVAVPVMVVFIPADYFAHRERRPAAWAETHPVIRLVLLTCKAGVGLLFTVAGVAMLILPGQGLLTILVGLMLLNFPGKYRLEQWLVRLPPVIRGINWIRLRSGRKPLVVES